MTPQEKIDALTLESQTLGVQVDAIRERRRAINAEIAQLQNDLVIESALASNPALVEALRARQDATAPGAVVSVTGAEVIRAMAAGLTKQ